ncbi:hypothetical protein [Hymenobacter cavernae]|uniref:DUF4177 domain-containing protein n=1 Tax=Hymenobacter cavernae TaxID=2044852 RepID=A0ABQ1U2U6_9BACT|nr:hypothetical protein [Hymenobacter cavernae]GGF08016.1 hypothetical protein GCM10011383_18930 [Hymenobacter cavernae]
MKKLFFFLALGLVAAGSWSFYPKAAASSGYLMLVGSGRPGKTRSAEITTIYPDGKRQVQELENIWVGKEGPTPEGAIEVHHAELLALNRLYAKGWQLVSIAQSTVGVGASTETVYMLEKR